MIQRLEGEGIRFFTLANEPGEMTERSLYALNRRVAPDFPGRSPDVAIPPFDRWQQRFRDAYSAHPDLVIIAAEGRQPVGVTRMTLDAITGGLYTPHTAVDRNYRGRGIALALKLLSIRTARRYEAPVLTTSNDSLTPRCWRSIARLVLPRCGGTTCWARRCPHEKPAAHRGAARTLNFLI